MKEVPATNLDELWANFDPMRPLDPDSPFKIVRKRKTGSEYVDINRRWLRDLARSSEPKAWYLTGHRGCGKSTMLRGLLADHKVQEKYLPIYFAIQERTDRQDLQYQEVLFAIAAALIEQAIVCQAVNEAMQKRLDTWARTVTRYEENTQGFSLDTEAGAGVNFLHALLTKFMLKLQREHKTRETFREEIEPQVSELINIIDEVTQAIENKTSKMPLVAIDDLDKPNLERARVIFGDHAQDLEQPQCHIIYTVPVALLHDTAVTNIGSDVWYLPNVKIYHRGAQKKPSDVGFETMQDFLAKRISSEANLVSAEATEALIHFSGGVFRQMCSLVQRAVDIALDQDKTYIDESDVQIAANELQNDLVLQLDEHDITFLATLSREKSVSVPHGHLHLLHNLATLRYLNDHYWHDVNPLLDSFLFSE